jgi:hypothetical protein
VRKHPDVQYLLYTKEYKSQAPQPEFAF